MCYREGSSVVSTQFTISDKIIIMGLYYHSVAISGLHAHVVADTAEVQQANFVYHIRRCYMFI